MNRDDLTREFVEEFGGCFWTVLDEMVEEIESARFAELEVVEANDEYIVVVCWDIEEELVIYLGHANKTMWIEAIRTF